MLTFLVGRTAVEGSLPSATKTHSSCCLTKHPSVALVASGFVGWFISFIIVQLRTILLSRRSVSLRSHFSRRLASFAMIGLAALSILATLLAALSLLATLGLAALSSLAMLGLGIDIMTNGLR
jgi:hypothetical protein